MVVREELCARKEPMSQKVQLYPQITESANQWTKRPD